MKNWNFKVNLWKVSISVVYFYSFISFSVVFLGYFGHSDEENNNRIENNSAVEMQVKLIEVTASIDKKENETAKDQRSKLKLMQVDNEEKEKLGAFMSALSLFESGYFYDIAESIFNSKEFEEYRELAGDSLKVPTHSDQDKISLIVGGEFEMLWREPLESLSLTDFEKASVGQLIYNDITLRAELNTMLANFEISRREYEIELAALPSLYASLESHISLSDIDQLKNAQGQVARERDFSPELYSALEDMKKNPAYVRNLLRANRMLHRIGSILGRKAQCLEARFTLETHTFDNHRIMAAVADECRQACLHCIHLYRLCGGEIRRQQHHACKPLGIAQRCLVGDRTALRETGYDYAIRRYATFDFTFDEIVHPPCRLLDLLSIYMTTAIHRFNVIPGWHDIPVVDRDGNRRRMGENEAHTDTCWQIKLGDDWCKVVTVGTETVQPDYRGGDGQALGPLKFDGGEVWHCRLSLK